MKKLFTILVIMLLAAIDVQAQKIDERLTSLLPSANDLLRARDAREGLQIDTAAVMQQINVRFNSDCTVRSFSAFAMLKEGADCPSALLQKLGVEIREKIGRMLILNIPAESLLDIGDIDEIESVSADQMTQAMNNHGREKSRVSEVATLERALANNLPEAYTGKGVVVGVIDQGIDFNHAAFRYADGTSRVKMARVFDYGQDTTYTKPADIAELTTDLTSSTHGTHVAGIAAGSIVTGANNEVIDKQGMAPEAELVFAGLGSAMYESYIISSIKQMFDYAKEQGTPCVINCSIGANANFHDDIVSQIPTGLKEYFETEGRAGRICVFPTDNHAGKQKAIYEVLPEAGDDGYNLRTILGESWKDLDQKEVISVYNNINNFFYMIDGSDFDVDVFAVDVTNGKRYTLDEKPLHRAINDEDENQLPIVKTIHPKNSKTYIRISSGGLYAFQEPNLKLAFYVKGTAGKTLRVIDDRINTPGYQSCGLAGFTDGGDNGAFNILCCTDDIISVGSYVSSTNWIPVGKTVPKEYDDATLKVEGGIAGNSSWGLDDNGKSHPDVIAPGSAISSAYNLYAYGYFDEKGKMDDLAIGAVTDSTTLFGRKHYYGVDKGTSMATPNVAGVIALWLQANPSLTTADVRALIKETSYNDQYTTDATLIPSGNVMQAGAGKIDALRGLQVLTGTTDIQTAGADGRREATPATMYNAEGWCYNALGQRVDRKTKGLVMYRGKKYVNR